MVFFLFCLNNSPPIFEDSYYIYLDKTRCNIMFIDVHLLFVKEKFFVFKHFFRSFLWSNIYIYNIYIWILNTNTYACNNAVQLSLVFLFASYKYSFVFCYTFMYLYKTMCGYCFISNLYVIWFVMWSIKIKIKNSVLI